MQAAEQELLERVRELVDSEDYIARTAEADRTGKIAFENVRALQKLGVTGMVINPDFGEGGASVEAAVRIIEAVSYRDASTGVALNMQQTSDAYYELSYNRQSAGAEDTSAYDMTIEHLHIGGYVTFRDPEARFVPYFLMTVGATRFSPDRNEFDDVIEPSLAIGGGVKRLGAPRRR